MDSLPVTNYRFTMSPPGTWRSEGDIFIYTGPCLLEAQFCVNGGVVDLPTEVQVRMVSFTIPPRPAESPVVPAAPVPSDSSSIQSAGKDGFFPSVLGKRERPSDDSEEAIKATDIAGPSGVWKEAEEEADDEPVRDGLLRSFSDPEEERDDSGYADDCVEMVCIEDSVEVIDLLSDSDPEEDLSEGSYTPSSPGA